MSSYVAELGMLAEIAVAFESTYGTYATPTVQLPHAGITRWGRGHQPVEAVGATSTTQHHSSYRAVRGHDTPGLGLDLALSDNDIATVFRMIFGGTLSGGTWPISDTPSGVSIGVATGAGLEYWKFAGCRLVSAEITGAIGSPISVSMDWVAKSLVDPKTAPTTFPTLSPTQASAVYTMVGMTFDESSSTSFATNIPIQGFNLSINRGSFPVHGSGATEPQSVVTGMMDITGSIDFVWSTQLQADFESQVAVESDLGYTLRYFQMQFTDGTNTQKLVMPVKYDWSEFSAPIGNAPVTVSVPFVAANDGTNAVATVTDV